MLLAEDHPLNVEITRKLLERRGVEVVCAEDGRQALELFMERALFRCDPDGYCDVEDGRL